jgi:hypothetical protein
VVLGNSTTTSSSSMTPTLAGAISAGTIGLFLLVVLVLLGCWLFCRARRQHHQGDTTSDVHSKAYAQGAQEPRAV